MTDDEAVVILVFLLNQRSQCQPLGSIDVGTVQIEGLDCVDLTEIPGGRNVGKELFRRNLRTEPLTGIFGSDGSAGGDQKNLFHGGKSSCLCVQSRETDVYDPRLPRISYHHNTVIIKRKHCCLSLICVVL